MDASHRLFHSGRATQSKGDSDMQVSNTLRALCVLSFAAIVAVEPALAGCLPAAVPAPLLGAGIPALVAFGAGYWAIRKRPKG
jgi:hypothetical protein